MQSNGPLHQVLLWDAEANFEPSGENAMAWTLFEWHSGLAMDASVTPFYSWTVLLADTEVIFEPSGENAMALI
jgi:hypothetical protein